MKMCVEFFKKVFCVSPSAFLDHFHISTSLFMVCRSPILALLALLGGAAYGTTLDLYLLPKDTYPKAICNDNTQSGYYIRPSATSKVWIIHQVSA